MNKNVQSPELAIEQWGKTYDDMRGELIEQQARRAGQMRKEMNRLAAEILRLRGAISVLSSNSPMAALLSSWGWRPAFVLGFGFGVALFMLLQWVLS